jgi:hypothetical protein
MNFMLIAPLNQWFPLEHIENKELIFKSQFPLKVSHGALPLVTNKFSPNIAETAQLI